LKKGTHFLVGFLVGLILATGMWEPVVQRSTEITKRVLEDERDLFDCNASRIEGEALYQEQVLLMRGKKKP